MKRINRFSITTFSMIFALILATPAFAGNVTYSYDALSRLMQVSYDDGTTITYTYDKVGNRVTRTVVTS